MYHGKAVNLLEVAVLHQQLVIVPFLREKELLIVSMVAMVK